jgi:hypothetical protein
MPTWTIKAPLKTTRKYSNALAGYAKKTAARRPDYRIEVSANDEKNNVIALNGCVSPKVHKKISTAVFTA